MIGGERQTLCAFLDFHRATLAMKCDGLSDDDLRPIVAFDSTTLSGLLQTPSYARAMITAGETDAAPGQIDRWVELRMARQAILASEEPPLLRMVLDEALLRRKVGGRVVLREQLAHLLQLAKRPNIELRVLTFESGAHASPSGAFKLFRMPEPYPEAGYAETPAGALYVEPPKTERLAAAYDGVQKMALGTKASQGVISSAIDELE